ncbi:MAG: hypothetical protein QF741_00320 [Candidatus Peribacteraceae bacterium]|jgi:hypothetical protein|nr:hypothetical protein [Candidatus Peribacteraceae bacterium]MDP7454189.1 hypothetical protein [Candidatus Peribacteraceae bacterium]MDP7645699.1 hypothetical protein [Candidatus Peribacteraceae bacterium]
MKNLHLIGVLHNDPNGYERTMNALQALHPQKLAVEWAGTDYDQFLSSQSIRGRYYRKKADSL